MSAAGALPGLPGSTQDPGEGPAEPGILDGLLDAPLDGPPGGPLDARRALATGELRDLLGAVVVPADRVAELIAALTAADLGTPVLLATDEPDPVAALEALDAGRSALWDEDRLEVVGRRLAFPGGTADPVATARALLPVLGASVPTWIVVPPGTPDGVLDVLAADGAEHVTIDVAAGDPPAVARLVRTLVDRDLTFRVAGTPALVAAPSATGPAVPGVLNVLCAVRAALNGAEPAELAQVLTTTGTAALTSAVRRMSAADGAVVRAFLAAAEVPDVTACTARLVRLGLVDESVP